MNNGEKTKLRCIRIIYSVDAKIYLRENCYNVIRCRARTNERGILSENDEITLTKRDLVNEVYTTNVLYHFYYDFVISLGKLHSQVVDTK